MTKKTEDITESSLASNLKQFFNALTDNQKQRRSDKFEQVKATPLVSNANHLLSAGRWEQFDWDLIDPLEDIATSIVEDKYEGKTESGQLVFLLTKQTFIRGHLSRLFQTFEGLACSADKERTVFNAIARWLINGDEIKFNYNGDYTFQLPKKILTTHEDVICYFVSIYNLYYGRSDLYLMELKKISNAVTKPSDE